MSNQEEPIYEQIGTTYDTTRKADPYLVSRLANYLQIHDSANYLDLGCGTGNYTVALKTLYGGTWTGADVSSRMLSEAKRKNGEINWLLADSANLDLPANAFDGAMSTFAIHHFDDLSSALNEVSRVLKDDGRYVILTSTPEQMQQFWLYEYFPQAINGTIGQLLPFVEIEKAINQARMKILHTALYSVHEDLQDLFLYSGKFRPAIYLDPNVRAGISTFAMFGDPLEVESGCNRLRTDIQSGRVADIQAKYHHDRGEGLFIVAGH